MYLDRREARIALDKLLVRRNGHKTERTAYQCRYCDRWHLSSMGERPNTLNTTRMEPVRRWRWNHRVDSDE